MAEYKVTNKKKCPECGSKDIRIAGEMRGKRSGVIIIGSKPSSNSDGIVFSCNKCEEDFIYFPKHEK